MRRFLKRLADCFFTWKFPEPSLLELVPVGVIVTQAWSKLRDGQPGPGNTLLADTAIDLSWKRGFKVIAQEEVAYVYPGRFAFVARAPKSCTDGRSTPEWNTYMVAVKQAEICLQYGWQTVLVVAAPVHMGRALWVYERLGFRALPAPVHNARAYNHPDTVHWSTRGSLLWTYIRELMCRLLFLWQGKI